MPWRREPELDEARRRYLVELRTVPPDATTGVYPFKGVRLDRADVEWLLATHVDGRGITGPVEWQDERQWRYDSLDLRGANLSRSDLSHLPLARLLGSLRNDEWLRATPEVREQSVLHLERANLRRRTSREPT